MAFINRRVCEQEELTRQVLALVCIMCVTTCGNEMAGTVSNRRGSKRRATTVGLSASEHCVVSRYIVACRASVRVCILGRRVGAPTVTSCARLCESEPPVQSIVGVFSPTVESCVTVIDATTCSARSKQIQTVLVQMDAASGTAADMVVCVVTAACRIALKHRQCFRL